MVWQYCSPKFLKVLLLLEILGFSAFLRAGCFWGNITMHFHFMSDLETLTHNPLDKLLPFSRRYFQMNFLEWKFCTSIRISLKFLPNGLMNDKSAFGSGNGLAPNRRHGIIWTKADSVYPPIHAAQSTARSATRGWVKPQASLSPSNWSALYRRSRLASHELNIPLECIHWCWSAATARWGQRH